MGIDYASGQDEVINSKILEYCTSTRDTEHIHIYQIPWHLANYWGRKWILRSTRFYVVCVHPRYENGPLRAEMRLCTDVVLFNMAEEPLWRIGPLRDVELASSGPVGFLYS